MMHKTASAQSGQPLAMPISPDDDATEPPGLDALAVRFLDLWQNQWLAMIADPAIAKGAAQAWQTMGKAMEAAPAVAAAIETMQRLARGDNPHAAAATSASGCAAPGTAPTGAASVGDSVDLAGLAERVAILERQVAALAGERGGHERLAQPARRSRPRRSVVGTGAGGTGD
jgi:hypothetical protein